MAQAGWRLSRPDAILTDIEGTTTPIAFVRDVLFPYARARLPVLLATRGEDAEVAEAVAEAQVLAGNRPVLEMLLDWLDSDAKKTPLKTLQGIIWDEGYRNGALTGPLYPDVPAVLRAWHSSGLRLYIYSSGSTAAQRLIFSHSDAGDLSGLFSGFFDTRIGPKRETASYRAIAEAIGLPADKILFLSDVEAELDAAAQAGLGVCQLVRPADGTTASLRHPNAPDFATVAHGID